MRVRVADHKAAHRDLAGRGVDDGFGLDAVRLERPGGDEGLDGRAGLEGVGESPVAQLRACEVAAIGRRVARKVRERQHLAAARIEHDHAAGLGFVLRARRLRMLLVSKELHFRCRSTKPGRCRGRRPERTCSRRRLPPPGPCRSLITRREPARPCKFLVSCASSMPSMPLVFYVGEAHHMGYAASPSG